MKASKNTFWSSYWTLTFWLVIVLSLIGFLIGIGGTLYVEYIEPKPIDEKYAYYINNENRFEPVYFYKNKKKARQAIVKYDSENTVGQIIIGSDYPPSIYPGDKILIIRHSKDSTILRVRRIRKGFRNQEIIDRGWMPAITLHDTIDVEKYRTQFGKEYKNE